jgi:transposase
VTPSYDDLAHENERLRAESGSLRQQLAALQAKLDEALRLLEEARRASKRQAAPFRKGPPEPDPKPPGRKSGPAHGKHGHRPPPPPDQVQQTFDAPLPATCPCCGGAVQEHAVAPQYQTELPRRPIVRQFNVHLGSCQSCGKAVQGRHPLQTSDALGAAASQLGPDAQAAVVQLNKEAGLSHGKVSACLRALFGICLTRGASAQVVLRAAARLRPCYQQVREAIAGSERIYADETGWRVGGRPAWLHVWVGEQATCYAIDPHRDAGALEQVIGLGYDGVLGHDGLATYGRFEAASHQQCLAHLLRRLRDLLAVATRGAARLPRALIALFTAAIHRRNEHLAGRVSALELERSRDADEDALLRLVRARRVVPAYETLCGHLHRHFAEWFTFLSEPKVEATNWPAEQAIRPAVVNRKVWGGNRTEAGAEAQAVLTSVWQTAKRQGLAALDFVSQALRAFGNRLLPQPCLLAPR